MRGKCSSSLRTKRYTIHYVGHDELQNVHAHASRPGLGISDKDVLLTLWKAGVFCREEDSTKFRSVTEKAYDRREPSTQIMRVVKGRRG